MKKLDPQKINNIHNYLRTASEYYINTQTQNLQSLKDDFKGILKIDSDKEFIDIIHKKVNKNSFSNSIYDKMFLELEDRIEKNKEKYYNT